MSRWTVRSGIGPAIVTSDEFQAILAGARAGDDVWLCGPGGAAMMGFEAPRDETGGDSAAYRRPRPLLAEGRDFSHLTLDEWRQASEMFGDDAPRAATALASVQAKRSPQSTNPDAVRGALTECRQWVEKA